MAQTVDFRYRVDISELTNNLKKLPGITAKEAKAMTRSLDRSMKRAEAASKKAAAGTATAWKKAGDPLKSFEKDAGKTEQVIQGLNGAITKINPEMGAFVSYAYEGAGAIRAVARGGSSLLGVLGPVAAAVAVAAAAYSHFSSELEDAEERMRDAAAAATDMQRVVAQLETAKATKDLEYLVSIGEAQVGQLKERKALLEAENVHRGVKEKAETRLLETSKKQQETRQEILSIEQDLSAASGADMVSRTALVAKHGSYAQAQEKINDLKTKQATLDKQEAARREVIAGINQQIETHADKTLVIESRSEKTSGKRRKGKNKDLDLYKEELKAIERLSAMTATANTARLEGEDLIIDTAKRQIIQIDEIAEKHKTSANAQVAAIHARTEVAITMETQIAEHRAKVAEEAKKQEKKDAEERKEIWVEYYDARFEQAEAAHAAWEEQMETRREGLEELTTGIASVAGDAAAVASEKHLKAAEETTGKTQQMHLEAAQKAFKLEQAAAVSAITINTALAMADVWAKHAANPVLAGALTAVAGAAMATQMAAVAGAEPPSLHVGGMIRNDETAAVLRKGEGVLTAQGVRNIGGPGGVASANSGGGRSAPMVVQHVYQHRHLDTVVKDHLKRNTALKRATASGRSRGRTNPYSGSI